MDKSTFKVTAMDCGAEQAQVRMGLDTLPAVTALEFDMSARIVSVYHQGDLESISAAMNRLRLGSSYIQTSPSDGPSGDDEPGLQRRLLWTVLLINLAFFVLEMTTGLISKSMGLVADSLDMLADALVYGISLMAVGTTVARKKSVARWSGYFQGLLAVAGFIEVLRRFFGQEDLPDYQVMIVISVLALIANTVCLYLLRQSTDREAHMQASMIFTSNDIIINLGIVAAALLVMWSQSGMPDLLIGSVVFMIVMRGALRILALAK